MAFGKAYRYVPSLSWQANPQLGRVLAEAPTDGVIVDLGAGGRKIAPGVIATDFAPLPGTECVCNAAATPFADDSVDLVIATGLIEEVEDERALVAEMWRILKPGGVAHVEAPFLLQYHPDPIDCRRFTRPGLERLLRQAGFEIRESGVHIGPTAALLTLTAYWIALWFEGPGRLQKLASNGAFAVVSTALWPLKFLDALLIRKATAERIACGVYCVARKSGNAEGTGAEARIA